MAELAVPSVPTDRLGDEWALQADAVETLFEVPTLRVRGRTLRYEDEALRERIREATGEDGVTRFLFATSVGFEPSLTRGGASIVRPTVVSKARQAFARRLRERGIESVELGRCERTRTDGGDRIAMASYRGEYALEDGTLPVEGWVGVWHADGFRIAGGAHPRSLDGLGIDADASTYRDDLLAAIRGVQ